MRLSWTPFLDLDFSDSILILTPNQRLSKFLHQQYQQHGNSGEPAAFYGGKIQAIDQYLQQSFIELQFTHAETYASLSLLDSHQELGLWLEFIQASKQAEALWFTSNIARQAMEAYQYSCLWYLPEPDSESLEAFHYLGEDQKAFYDWQTHFNRYCYENNCLSTSQLYNLVTKAVREDRIQGPKTLYCYGFDDLNPAQENFLQALEQHSRIVRVGLPETPAHYQALLGCDDFKTELIQAAHWAKAVQEQDPQASIAVVVPSLNENRALVDNIFTQILIPEHLNLQQESKVKPYNISSGTSLSNTPLVKSALHILDLLRTCSIQKKVEISKLHTVSQSPFIFNNSYSMEQALDFSRRLKKLRFKTISTNNLLKLIGSDKNQTSESLTDFYQRLTVFFSEINNLEKKQSYSQWSQCFLTKLSALGWLENFELNSENYQICTRFIQKLEQLASFDECLPPCNYAEALQSLIRMLDSELFQVESIHEDNNQINVLGILEAAAQDFSHLWLCEMHNENWPGKEKPNPFLPYSLQKIKQTPHASAQRELHFSQQMTQRFLHHCQFFIASYAMKASGQEQKPSELMRSIKQVVSSTLAKDFRIKTQDSITDIINSSAQWGYFSDNKALPLDTGKAIKGGQSILKNQSQCPFCAFAANRLQIKADDARQEGLSALDRGLILHRFMELVWKDLKNQEALKQLSDQAINTKLDTIRQSMEKEYARELKIFTRELALECQRAMEIAGQVLTIENNREAFSVIAFEQMQEINIEGLTINLRIDRVDQLENGDELIIDYKSSKSSTANWLSPRMEEPQLPLYLMNNDKAIGISFVTLNKLDKEQGFTGIASRPGIAPGIDDCHDDKKRRNKHFTLDWESLRADWKNDLHALASDFVAGNTRVDPKDIRKSCTYCDYASMCRIQEIAGVHYDDD